MTTLPGCSHRLLFRFQAQAPSRPVRDRRPGLLAGVCPLLRDTGDL